HPQIPSPRPVRYINHHDRCGVQFHRANIADDPDDLVLFLTSPESQAGAANRVLARPEALRNAFGNHNDLPASIAFAEYAAVQESNAHGREIVWARSSKIRRKVKWASRRNIKSRDTEKRCAHTDLNANERLTQSSCALTFTGSCAARFQRFLHIAFRRSPCGEDSREYAGK